MFLEVYGHNYSFFQLYNLPIRSAILYNITLKKCRALCLTRCKNLMYVSLSCLPIFPHVHLGSVSALYLDHSLIDFLNSLHKSKKDSNDQESIPSSTTPVPG